jgi:hypothetical protein
LAELAEAGKVGKVGNKRGLTRKHNKTYLCLHSHSHTAPQM